MNKPIIVCLCGSTRFKDTYEVVMREETLKGKIVLSVGMYGHIEMPDMVCGGPVKEMLDELHLRKIDLSDEVLILNVGGYIGESTYREMVYAYKNGKVLRFLEPVSNDYREYHGIL